MGRYRDLLRLPGGAAFSSAGLVLRFGLAMVSFALVIMVRALYGSYGLGGSLAAVYGIAVAAGTALLAGPVDRFGQRRVMVPCAVISLLALGTVLVLAQCRVAPAWLFLPTAVTGLTVGSPGALVRARWHKVVRSPDQLHTAFSWEGTIEEVTFVLGPAVATFLATGVAPVAGLAAPLLLCAVGATWFYSLKAGLPTPTGRAGPANAQATGPAPVVPNRTSRPLLFYRGVLPLVAVCFVIGLSFGAINVSTIASSEAWGAKSLAGVVAGVISLGSCLGGLAWGARTWQAPKARLFVLSALVMGLMVMTFWFPATPWQRAGWGFFIGATFAPSMINANALVEGLVPAGRLTSGLSYVGAAIGIGAALGAPLGGRLIDIGGYRYGVACEAATGALLIVCTLLAAPCLRPRPASPGVTGGTGVTAVTGDGSV
jgi:MFS family permease